MDERGHAVDPGEAYAAAVYGSIVTTALIVALYEEHTSLRSLTLTVLSTMIVFWLAHVWSAVMGERMHAGGQLERGRLALIAREEWPMVEAGLVPVAALALGWAHVFDRQTAVRAAVTIGIVQLFAYGIVVGRKAYDGWPRALLAGAMNGVLGLVLVALEVRVLH